MMNYFNKKEYLPILIRVIFLCFAVSSLSPKLVLADSTPIITGVPNMPLGTSTKLSILNYRTGTNYTWQLVSGVGSLSDTTGHTVTYSVPVSFGGEDELPMIVVTDDESSMGTKEIGFYPQGGGDIQYVIEIQSCQESEPC